MRTEKFNLTAVVRREVLDDIVLQVEAQDPFEALAKADRALNVFPEPHEESGIPIMYIKSRRTDALEIVSLQEDD